MANYDDSDLRRWYSEWENGRSKNDIERVEFNDPYSHGKRLSREWRECLGIETEKKHPMLVENERLRQKLLDSGISAD